MSAIALMEIYRLQSNQWTKSANITHGANVCTFMNIFAVVATVWDSAWLKMHGEKNKSLWFLVCKIRLFLYLVRILSIKGCMAGCTLMSVASCCCCGRVRGFRNMAMVTIQRFHWAVWSIAILLNHRISHLIVTIAVSKLPVLDSYVFHREALLYLCLLSLYL